MSDGREVVTVTLRVNGTPQQARVTARDTLLDVLRRELHLFSCRETCGIGLCGSCTVLVDQRAVSACLAPAFTQDGAEVTTAEGLEGEDLHPVQRAFVEEQAFQCSFCTPGFLMSAVGALAGCRSELDVEAALSGHLCRCGSYEQIVRAVRRAAAADEGAVRG